MWALSLMFFYEFPKNIQNSYFKSKASAKPLFTNLPYFIKEHLWMSASNQATVKKHFWWSKPSSKLTLKTKCYHSCGCCDDCQSCEKLKKHVLDEYFEKNVRLWTLITFHYRKCVLLLQCLSDWYLHGVYVWQKFWRKKILNWVIIWIKFKVLCLL